MKRLLPLILLIVACGSNAAATPSSSQPVTSTPATPTVPADAIAVHLADFKVTPSMITAHGSTLNLLVTNDGPTIHNLTIRDDAGTVLMGTNDLRPGESQLLVGAIAAGDFVTFCSLPGHASLGLKGNLTVIIP